MGKWLIEEIEILKTYGATKQIKDLKELLPLHTTQSISKMRNRLKIQLSNDYISEKNKYAWTFKNCYKMDQSLVLNDFDTIVFQILIGSMLGDGSITRTKGAKNFLYSEGHAVNQFDYLDWKMKKLSCFFPRWNSKKKPLISTASHPLFTSLRDKFYPSRDKCDKSILPMDLIVDIDMFGLMIWYLDDGYLGTTKSGYLSTGKKQCPMPSIAAKGWNYDELVKAVTVINNKLNLSLYVMQYKHREGMNKVIEFGKNKNNMLIAWQKIAIKYNLPKCMFYKLRTFKCDILKF